MSRTTIKAPLQPITDEREALQESVSAIIRRVRTEGDAALRVYAKQFDKVELENIRVSGEEIEEAGRTLPRELLEDMSFGIERIRGFAEAQLTTLMSLDVEVLPGVHLG